MKTYDEAGLIPVETPRKRYAVVHVRGESPWRAREIVSKYLPFNYKATHAFYSSVETWIRTSEIVKVGDGWQKHVDQYKKEIA